MLSMQAAGARDEMATRGTGSRRATEEPIVDQDLWPARLLKARQWGHLLQKEQGGEEASVAKLLVTLKDQRTHTEQPLRLSAVNSLTAAVLAGHRGALAAQAEALMDRRKVVRRSALEGLGQAASQPELGVPAQLSQVMPPPDARYQVESRRAAADALSLLGPKGSDQLLPMVRDWLQDEDAEVRASAAKATGVMSSTVADVERIAPLLQDKNWRVSEASIEALESISGGTVRHRCKRDNTKESGRLSSNSSRSSGSKVSASKTLPSLLPAGSRPPSSSSRGGRLETPESGRGGRRGVSKLSSESSTVDPESMPKASAVLLAASSALAAPSLGAGGDSSSRLLLGLPRAEAVAALRRIAPWGHGPSLEAAAARLRDVDGLVRREAVEAVAALAPGSRAQAFDLCAWALEEADWRARAAAVDAFAASAPAAGDEQAFLTAAELLSGPDWPARRGAIGALRALIVATEEQRPRKLDFAMEAVAPKLQHEHWSVRRFAVMAMAGVCEVMGGHRKGLRKLKELSADPDEQVRLALAAHLGRVAPQKSKEAVVAALQLAMKDEDLEVRVAALLAVSELCSAERCRTRKAVRQVALLFADEEEEVRFTAQKVMCSIGWERRCAVDALAKLLENPQEEVRLLAARTFKSVAGAQKPRAMKRAMRLVRRSTTAGVRDAASKAMAFEEEDVVEKQDPEVILAASAMVMKWRPNRFKGIRGHMLSAEERLANYAARGEDPAKDQDWLKLFGPRKAASKSKKGPVAKPKNQKRKPSQQSSLSRGDTSSQMSESEAAGEESDDNKSTTSHRSDATASSRISKASKQSSAVDSKYKGKGAESRKQQMEDERERAKRDKDKQQRLKEMQTIMESSSEEEFSESGTEEESDEDDMMTAVEKILAKGR